MQTHPWLAKSCTAETVNSVTVSLEITESKP